MAGTTFWESRAISGADNLVVNNAPESSEGHCYNPPFARLYLPNATPLELCTVIHGHLLLD